MKKLSIPHIQHCSNNDLIFEKKNTTNARDLTFKKFYLSQEEQFSPYSRTLVKQNFLYLKKFSSYVKKFFNTEKGDNFSQEKLAITNLVIDLIQNNNYDDVNIFLQKGFIPDSKVVDMIVSNSSIIFTQQKLLNIQVSTPLYGILAQTLFISDLFISNCHDILRNLQQHFSEELLSPELLSKNLKNYKNICINNSENNNDYTIAAIQMHNLCLNPAFAIDLFCYCLKRIINYEKYDCNDNQYNESWNLDSSLMILFSYVKKYLNQDDKNFIFDIIRAHARKEIDSDNFHTPSNFYDLLLEDIDNAKPIKYTQQDIHNLLAKVPEVYQNQISQSVNCYHLLPLNTNEELLPSQYQNIIITIKNIYLKLDNNKDLIDNEHIAKINKIVSETLPTTIEKYEKIDIEFRDTLKNIEGKTANDLFEQSLQNILLVMKDAELHLEKSKLNDLSIHTRKSKNS